MATDQPTRRESRRREYESRKARGLCVRCPAPAVPGKAQCAECIVRQAAKRVRIRDAGRANGTCTTCEGERDRPGRKLCSKCNAVRVEERANRVGSGRCPCGRSRDVAGRRKCSACNALENQRKQGRKAAGLCPCGHAPAEPGHKCCLACLAYHYQHSVRRTQKRRDDGLCPGCGKVPPRPRRSTCKACCVRSGKRSQRWFRAHPDHAAAIWAACRHRREARIAENGGDFTATEWRALKRKHNHTCLRCRRREPEIRLTVDHVVPVTKGGRNSIDNIQPLCMECNNFKGVDDTDYRP